MPYDIIFINDIAKQYKVIGTPTQVAIDINGKISYIGMNVPEDLEDIIEEMLDN